MSRRGSRRLYRGLKEPYRPELVPTAITGTDFTDCPFTALRYATGRRSVLIVIDVPPEDESRVSKELWLGAGAERYMVWGAFDPWIAAIFPAKELRAEIRKKGVATAHDEDKSAILSRVIDRRIDTGDGAFALEVWL